VGVKRWLVQVDGVTVSDHDTFEAADAEKIRLSAIGGHSTYGIADSREHPPGALCVECGARDYSTSYAVSTREQMLARALCFTCLFWHDLLASGQHEPERVVVADGVHYQIGEEARDVRWRGFGGRRWIIRFRGGRVVTTTNLWYQGPIPPKMRARFPADVLFLRAEPLCPECDGAYGHAVDSGGFSPEGQPITVWRPCDGPLCVQRREMYPDDHDRQGDRTRGQS